MKMDIYQYVFPYIKSNMYIAIDGDTALIIDPHASDNALVVLKEKGIRKIFICLTHEHFDHTSGVNWIKKNFNATLICQRSCAENIAMKKNNRPLSLALLMKDTGQRERMKSFLKSFSLYQCETEIEFDYEYSFTWNENVIDLRSCPGHSQGSTCISLNETYIFTGDSLIPDIPVITRYPGGDLVAYRCKTLPYLRSLAEVCIIMPGHGKSCSMSELSYKDEYFSLKA